MEFMYVQFHLQISQANNFHNIRVNSKYAVFACEAGCWLNWKRAKHGSSHIHIHTKTHTNTQRYDLVIIFFNHPLSSHQLCLTRRPADQLWRVLHDCGWWKQSDGDVEMKAGGERHSIYPTQKSMEDNLAQHFVLFFF